MYYTYYKSIIGVLKLTSDGEYLLSITGDDNIKTDNYHPFFDHVIKQLNLYFESKLDKFDIKTQQNTTEFTNDIYQTLVNTQIGQTLSYKQLASQANYENASQATGSAMKKNNLPIIIPCHRVIKNNGELGQYSLGGIENKKILLSIERRYKINQICKPYNFSQDDLNRFLKLNNKFSKLNLATSFTQIPDLFTGIITQVIYQQINYLTARKIEEQLYHLCDYEITPTNVLKLTKNDLQINESKYQYIKNVCHYVLNNPQEFEMLNQTNDEKLIYDSLIKIRGIGPWTIEMVLLFTKCNLNIFNMEDLIIKKVFLNYYEIKDINQFKNDIKGIESLVSINFWNNYKNI